jgi:hypothetical protein
VPDSTAFEAACTRLEQSAALDRLVARGTIRLVLKEAGLDPKTVTGRALAVAVERLLPAALSSRGVAEPERLSASIARVLESIEPRAAGDTPEAIFGRLGGA